MDAAPFVIVGVVVLSLLGILAFARRRRWNEDGSDDERRRSRGPDPPGMR